MAQVKGALAIESLKRNDHVQAEELFGQARDHFLRARSGQFPNTAAYDAHARMLRERAFRLFPMGSAEHVAGIAEALQIVSEGVDNVNEDGRVGLAELRSELMDVLGFDEEAIEQLREMASSGSSAQRAQYLVIIARLYISRRSGGAKGKDLKKALPVVNQACELDESSFPAWRLRAEIYSKLHPSDFDELLVLLQKAQKSAKDQDNCWIWYNMGAAAFNLEKYAIAADSFKRLNRFSRGHHHRAGTIELAGERGGGEPFEFFGRVVHGGARRHFRVRVDDLRLFGDLFFNARAQEFYTARLGDQVNFLVGFNYRGLVAVELKKK